MTRAKEAKPRTFFGLLVYPLSRTIMGARGGGKGLGPYHPCAGLIIFSLKQLAFLHEFLNLSLHNYQVVRLSLTLLPLSAVGLFSSSGLTSAVGLHIMKREYLLFSWGLLFFLLASAPSAIGRRFFLLASYTQGKVCVQEGRQAGFLLLHYE